MNTIQNPIIPGFHPDPSILRVEDDYYIATSTFEWFPGVCIHHSKDLVHWRLLTYPLDRVSQIDMMGVSDSGGVWAPCLTYDNGTYYLIYTVVRSMDGTYANLTNYLVTAPSVTGPWSEPVYLNKEGFDPSLFHDTDGKKYLLNMNWDFTAGNFGGIMMQEYDPTTQTLVGEQKIIFSGTETGLTEGPHLYKIGAWYYLLCAEGGTHWGHRETVARSKNLWGPYEADPAGPLITASDDAMLPIQRAGHGDLVKTQNGEWYFTHLGARPILSKGRSILGRESFIQKVMFTEDGWIRLKNGTHHPEKTVESPNLPPHPFAPQPEREDFDRETYSKELCSLRIPASRFASLTARKGYLRLCGMESLSSRFEQSLLARRQDAFSFEAETEVEFSPENPKQMAGLCTYYDTRNFYYAAVTWRKEVGKCLCLFADINGWNRTAVVDPVPINGWNKVYLRAKVYYDKLEFFYSKGGESWTSFGEMFDQSTLSDEACWDKGFGCFTGAFVGIACQDLSGRGAYADFDYFSYKKTE